MNKKVDDLSEKNEQFDIFFAMELEELTKSGIGPEIARIIVKGKARAREMEKNNPKNNKKEESLEDFAEKCGLDESKLPEMPEDQEFPIFDQGVLPPNQGYLKDWEDENQ